MIHSLFRHAAARSRRQAGPNRGTNTEVSVEGLERDLALFQAETLGVQSHVGQFGAAPGRFALSRRRKRALREMLECSTVPYILIDPRPGLHIVDANDAFTFTTLVDREKIIGDQLFFALPGNANEDNVAAAFSAYKTCAQTRGPHALPLQRYDIQNEAGGTIARYWRSTYLPILNDDERLIYIVNSPVPVATPG